MHHHKMVTQILLALTILNSVLAAPVLMEREQEISREDGTVAVRVPAEDTVAMLVKRPYDPGASPSKPAESPVDTLVKAFGTSKSGPLPSGPIVTGDHGPASPPGNHLDSQSQSTTTTLSHPGSAPAGAAAGAPSPQSTTTLSHPESAPAGAAGAPRPQSVASAASAKPSVPSKLPPKEKIFTPEKIKSIKIAGAAGLLTAGYLSLLLPEITQGGNQNNNS